MILPFLNNYMYNFFIKIPIEKSATVEVLIERSLASVFNQNQELPNFPEEISFSILIDFDIQTQNLSNYKFHLFYQRFNRMH